MILVIHAGCASKKAIKYTSKPIAPRSELAVIIDSPNNLKNVVFATFMNKGFKIKSFNASDLYKNTDHFDIRDFKKVAYSSGFGEDNTLLSTEKTYDNIFKLHLYNYELNKAAILEEIKNKMGVQYLIILDLRDWEKVSWARAIDLQTYEIIWVENYPTAYSDTIVSIVEHFIASMSAIR